MNSGRSWAIALDTACQSVQLTLCHCPVELKASRTSKHSLIDADSQTSSHGPIWRLIDIWTSAIICPEAVTPTGSWQILKAAVLSGISGDHFCPRTLIAFILRLWRYLDNHIFIYCLEGSSLWETNSSDCAHVHVIRNTIKEHCFLCTFCALHTTIEVWSVFMLCVCIVFISTNICACSKGLHLGTLTCSVALRKWRKPVC